MTRNEFLSKLKEALESEMAARDVQEQLDYYGSYIAEQVGKGQSEEEVVAELGDPWAIACSLLDVEENKAAGQESAERESVRGQRESSSDYQSGGAEVHAFRFDTWWKKLLLVLGILGVVLIVLAVIGGLFSLIMPLLLPILIVILVIRLFSGNRR